MDAARVKVLIVDDHGLYRTGLRALLEDQGFDVADSMGAAGIRLAGVFDPHVVVMDLHMRGMSEADATALMLDAVPNASILILTVASGAADVLDAVRAGASGYLLKDADLVEIVAGIRATAAGHSVIAPQVAGHLLLSVRTHDAGSVTGRSARAAKLSRREREVLTLVTRGCGNAEIAGRLFMSSSTVKHHVARLLEKLGVDNRVQAATFAVRQGLFDAR